jgi:RNA polymerase primary sigma factor
MPLGDLIQEGILGLLQALNRFDPDRGTRFSSYAYFYIKQAVRQARYNARGPISIPYSMVTMVLHWKKTSTL